MEKRIFIAVLISLAFLWLWAAVAPKLFPELVKKPVPAEQKTTTTAATAPSTTTEKAALPPAQESTSAPAPTATPANAPAGAPVAAPRVIETTVTGDGYIAKFSNRGAELVSFRLPGYKMPDGSPVDLVKAREPQRTDFPFSVQTTNPALGERINSALYEVTELKQKDGTVLQYHWSDGRMAVTKTFKLNREYLFDFAVNVTPPVPYRVAVGPGIRTLAADEKDSQFIITGNGVFEREEKLKVINREKADIVSFIPGVEYVGIEDNYFLVALRPTKAREAVFRRIETPVDQKTKRRDLYAGLNAAPDGVVSGSAFFGPKQTQILDRYGFERTLQFGIFGVIARVLLTALTWINGFTHNFGWAIIVLTIIIKLILYPLQHKQNVSMKKMQRLSPKMEAIKARYKKARTDAEQRQKMNTEMMKLYQQEGINPMGGCWPILLQVPILWGFYGLLSRAIELRGAPFIGWIHDLSAKDPYYITPILMTATMFIQQALTPATGDATQRRMFLIMPLVFGWIFKEFPSGLVLYWLVQNVLTIIQMLIMNKYWKDHPAELAEPVAPARKGLA